MKQRYLKVAIILFVMLLGGSSISADRLAQQEPQILPHTSIELPDLLPNQLPEVANYRQWAKINTKPQQIPFTFIGVGD